MTHPTEGVNNTGCGALRMTRKARLHDGGNREMPGVTNCTVRRRGGGVAKSADRAALGPCDAAQLSAAHNAAGETWPQAGPSNISTSIDNRNLADTVLSLDQEYHAGYRALAYTQTRNGRTTRCLAYRCIKKLPPL